MLSKILDNEIAMLTNYDLIVYVLISFDENTFFVMKKVQHKGQSVILYEFYII